MKFLEEDSTGRPCQRPVRKKEVRSQIVTFTLPLPSSPLLSSPHRLCSIPLLCIPLLLSPSSSCCTLPGLSPRPLADLRHDKRRSFLSHCCHLLKTHQHQPPSPLLRCSSIPNSRFYRFLAQSQSFPPLSRSLRLSSSLGSSRSFFPSSSTPLLLISLPGHYKNAWNAISQTDEEMYKRRRTWREEEVSEEVYSEQEAEASRCSTTSHEQQDTSSPHVRTRYKFSIAHFHAAGCGGWRC